MPPPVHGGRPWRAINLGLRVTFHPAGTLLASTGWEGRLWLWDPVLGRPWLTLTDASA